MMEAREVWVGGQRFREAVSRGLKSQGFLFYLAHHPEDEKLHNTGHQDVAYRHFLDWLGGTLSEEVGVLFAPTDPANRLYPPQRVLEDVIDLLNGSDIKAEDTELREQWPSIWSQDETIGWVYQYFTPRELRDQVRQESQAPRNSYELAFRNQFFTPQYVVEFLTDNTLGRIWYEMRRGQTALTEQCRYMVRRPNEVFLAEGQEPPKESASEEDLSQEELLKQPVFIPHRPKKDPRELKILDPASGSAHFLLYCFDVLQTIYEEAYNDPELGEALRKDYPTIESLRKDVPRLILAHNLYGIDIDRRATQIAALALWLRCQRAYKEMGITKDRPKITRCNMVCAEPMPGEKEMLKEFTAELQPKLLGHLVEVVFDKMKLAGEAGSLLKIEGELREAIASAKRQWAAEHERAVDKKGRPMLFSQAEMDRTQRGRHQAEPLLSEITDEEFWDEAEARVVDALRDYAAHAANGGRLRRQLFAEDAGHGFAFIDVCQKRFDVVLMNPPFGLSTSAAKGYLIANYTETWKDMYAAFSERSHSLLVSTGYLGAITPNMWQYSRQLRDFRQTLLRDGSPNVLVEVGGGVMDDAAVEASIWVASQESGRYNSRMLTLDLLEGDKEDRVGELARPVSSVWKQPLPQLFARIEDMPFCHHLPTSVLQLWQSSSRLTNVAVIAKGNTTFDDFRFLRLWWEIPPKANHIDWKVYRSGGNYQPYFASSTLRLDWRNEGQEARQVNTCRHGSDAQVMQSSKLWYQRGLAYPRVGSGIGVRVAQEGEIFSGNSVFIYLDDLRHLYTLLGVLNSSPVLLMCSAHGRYRKTETIAIKDLPIGGAELDALTVAVEPLARLATKEVYGWESEDETSPYFSSAGIHHDPKTSYFRTEQIRSKLIEVTCRISSIVQGTLRLTDEALPEPDVNQWNPVIDERNACERLVSWAVGVAFGRWNINYLPNCDCQDTPADWFCAQPQVCPAMLIGGTTGGYPLPIADSGVLVDDCEHPSDIVQMARSAIEAVFPDTAEETENTCCKCFNTRSLAEYLRKPGNGGFWTDHVLRYSAFRRKAPIYWLLQSSRKNYALWLYYHRLDKDILFKALVNYVEPKIRLEENRLAAMRGQKGSQGESGKGAKKLDKDIEKQEEFLSELRDFEEKLRRAANLQLEPDLNDGVVLNIAPLWELVPWKEAKAYWEELLRGEYEWSSIGKQLREKGLVK